MEVPSKPPLIVLMFENLKSHRLLKATVGEPKIETTFNEYVRRELSSWMVDFTVECDVLTETHRADGEGWLQALFLALEGVRRCIPEGEEDLWHTPDGIPSWVVLPRRVPISWGYDVYKSAERAMNLVEEDFIASVDARRLEHEEPKGP